jgi:hypothetical protein
MVGESVLIDRLAHSAEGYRLGATSGFTIAGSWKICTVAGSTLIVHRRWPCSGRHLIGQVGLVVGVETAIGRAGDRPHQCSCRAEVTLARRGVLSAWRASEVPNGSSLKSPIASTSVCTVTPLINLSDAEPILPPIAPVWRPPLNRRRDYLSVGQELHAGRRPDLRVRREHMAQFYQLGSLERWLGLHRRRVALGGPRGRDSLRQRHAEVDGSFRHSRSQQWPWGTASSSTPWRLAELRAT